MRRPSLVAALLLLGFTTAPRAAGAEATPRPYDDEWSVTLVCADTQDKSGLVKGYQFTFDVTIVDGKLNGQYGAKGAPSSIVLSGEVANDGTLEVKAVGHSGQSDYSAGKIARGTAYSYTMTGKLQPSSGQALRRELRPCTASFARR